MKERGIVKSVNNDMVTVYSHDAEGCGNCKCSGILCNPDARSYKAVAGSGLQVKKGDTVEVYISPGKSIKASFFVLLMPVLLMIGSYVVLEALFSFHEGVNILISLGFLAAGFWVNLFISKKTSQDMPEVVSVVESSNMDPEAT